MSANIQLSTDHLRLADEVDKERIMGSLSRLAAISDPAFGKEGVTRLAYSKFDIEGKNLIAKLMAEAGLEVRMSPIGNTFGRLSGSRCDGQAVLTGSHTDSVIRGGRFDGCVGVVCAIEALRILAKVKDELVHPLEVIDFAMEEAARFGVACLGSKVFMGQEIDESLWLLADSQGISIAQALSEMASAKNSNEKNNSLSPLNKAKLAAENSRAQIGNIRAYVELHVEQAGFLEENKMPIGIVDTCAMPTRWAIDIVGEQAHSGTTPMHRRRNALVAASEFVLLVDKICREESSKNTVGAVTKLSVEPNAMNTVPGKCSLFLDLRSTDKQSKDKVKNLLLAELEQLCQRHQVTFARQVITEDDPKVFSPEIMAISQKVCEALKTPYMVLPSRAGHDACNVSNRVKEVGMIFIPSRAGVSHHHEEHTDADEIVLGAKVLLLTLLELATKN